MKTMFYTMLLSSLVLCADKPYQDTITTSLPKPIIPFELSYYDICLLYTSDAADE